MIKKWKKASTVALGLTLSASLVACGSNDSGDKTAASASPSAAPAKQEPVKIDWLGYDSNAQVENPDTNPVVKLVQDKFNVKFNLWYADAQKWDETLNMRFAAGEMPDFMKISNIQTLPKLITQNVAAPIDEALVRKVAPNYAKYIDSVNKNAWDFGKVNGKLYALPGTNPRSMYPTVIVWRQDWLSKVGITKTPETLTEVEDALTKFRNNDPDGNGKKDTYGMSDFAIPIIMGAFGRPAFDDVKAAAKEPARALMPMLKDGKVVTAATQPEMREALDVLSKWYKAGLIDPEFITSENTTGYWADSQAFYNNKIGLTGKGMFYHWRNVLEPNNPADTLGGQYVNFNKSQPNGTIAFGKAPTGPKGASGAPQWATYANSYIFTTKGAKDPKVVEATLKMIDATFTDYDYFLTVTQGIKDQDWKLNGEQFVNMDKDPAKNVNAKGWNVFNPTNGGFSQKRDKFLFDFAEKNVKTKGYEPLALPATNAFAKSSNALAKSTIEAYFKIITGELPIDAFDEYVKKYYANGGTEVEKEWTEAYNQMLGK
ncbi:ABC transporter substrate-binding protein [Paenibacillus sp. CGMCC 1.16610]|uniref:ABC transporter substrate-binding protein n=1 Tax=Paenibacillus anseongense TaxID=2682845 RepID=A0ABW9U651_9BACL|nr:MULTISPECIES: ABC transporter substrate-binding protein [Paenibacillus]MBA2938906.1 ABC transporter substrate-binding protein [Paenibacillus sp. CGMCC 1.16610]MVQ34868.1 ABC transporter substrate-binding protein [Paenibacillus anseongense]